jgi:putative drug exporter of the RND superfamily
MSSPDAPTAQRGILARVARWSVGHRLAVLAGWVVLLAGVTFASSGLGGAEYSNNFSLAGTESQRATDVLQRELPNQAGDVDQIVFRANDGEVTDRAVRDRVAPMLDEVSTLPHVNDVVSPYGPAGAEAISRDGRIAFATVTFDEDAAELPTSAVDRVISTATDARSDGLQVELGGAAIEQAQESDLGFATAVGLGAAIVILLITFGSFVTMGLPIVTALLGLGTGVGAIAIGTRLIDMPDFSTELAVMIGLGVGIDYALFIVTRFRENYTNGQGVNDAVVSAMDTAGRAVLFAGTTVIVALLGMFALGISFLNGMAIAAALGVAMTMLAALTILPVLVATFGKRIGRRRRRRATATPEPAQAGTGFWPRWAGLIQRHPWRAGIAGLGVMLGLSAPALSLNLGSSDAGNGSEELTTRKAYDLLGAGFGEGFNGPLQLVAALPEPDDQQALQTIAGAAADTNGVASVSQPQLSPDGTTATFSVFPTTAPQDSETANLVNDLRDESLPPAADRTGATLLVGGPTAVDIDFSEVLSQELPVFIAIVVALSALLLLIVFRSLVVPLQAAFMNVLSIGAALGVTVAIFQWGWLGSLLGIEGGPIDAFIPVLMFAIVFGLSMDYEVFLVSRIHEEWARRHDASRAVVNAVSSTGRVITAAAAIMVAVFASFALGDERVLKMFGISFATAVFLDAFVIRSVLLPAVFELLGRATWWLPEWLERRLPHLAVDSESVAVDEDEQDMRQPTARPAFDEAG